ncbi:DUF397 domain-containing protein [Streptomyces sp. NPDC056628]|uniref:DUF397 domain-containing protein n=1 Tax=Streptomyces sp. NPDC056628 TaxID=3345882 RepID=UPI003689F0DE
MIRKSAAGHAGDLAWFKSSYSDGPDGDSCVEVARTPRAVHVRDSKDTAGPRFAVTPAVWAGFVAYAAGR